MKYKKTIFFVLCIAFLWCLPRITGFVTSQYIDRNQNLVHVNGLSVSFTKIKANKISLTYGSSIIHLENLRVSMQPWQWLYRGIHFDDVKINSLTIINRDSDLTSEETKSSAIKKMPFVASMKSVLINEVKVDDFSLGKVDGRIENKGLFGKNIMLTFHGLQQSTIEIESTNGKFTNFTYKIVALNHKVSGLFALKANNINFVVNEFKDIYPKGLHVTHDNNVWVVSDYINKKDIIGKIGGTNGFVNFVHKNVDMAFKYKNRDWTLVFKSRHLDLDFKHAKSLKGVIKMNEYPFMDRLLTGVIFANKNSNNLKINGQLHPFNYLSKDKLQFNISSVGAALSGMINYVFENGDRLNIRLDKKQNEQILKLKQDGKINHATFNASQIVYLFKDHFEIDWLPIKYGEYIWKNKKKTQFSLFDNGVRIAPDCFVNDIRGSVCFSLNLGQASEQSGIVINYMAKEKIDFSDWIPKPFIISDFNFKGSINLKYLIAEKYPIIDIEIEDSTFQFDPLIMAEIPFSMHSYINEGKGVIHFREGTWTYDMKLITAQGGQIVLDSQKEQNIQWSNLLSGYQNDTFSISNGSGHWNQKDYTCHMDIDFKGGEVLLSDYYPKVSNPVKVNRFNIPINFTFRLTNSAPIKLNVLGIEGLINIDLSVVEKESVWIANGEIYMLPGGIFRKNVEPVTVKEAKILYYNNDVLDPFIQLSLEKRQTLLTRQDQISNYKDELLGVIFYGKLRNYQIQTYSSPTGISEFIILQTVLINPILFSSQNSSDSSNLLGSLASSIRDIRMLLPIDQITFRPAERNESLIDPYEESSTVSLMKRITQSVGLYARLGSLPQDNIFSLIYRRPNRNVGTQLYSNYESQGINLVFSN